MEKLSKNFTWMAATNIISSLFSVTLGIYISRILAPEAMGYLSYVFTLIFFLANFIDLGLSTYGIREIAGDKPRFSEYVSEIVSFRLIIAIALFLFVVVATTILPEPGLMKALMIQSAVIFFIWALGTEWAFQGLEKMHMMFLSFAATGALQVGLVYLFVKKPDDVVRVPFLYILASFPIIILFLHKLKFRMRLSLENFRKISVYLSSSIVIWSISVLSQIYNNLDIFMLGLFRPAEEVGYFTVARRVTGGFAMFLIFLANAVLPRLSCAFAGKDMPEFDSALKKFLKLGLGITCLVLIPFMFFSKSIICMTVGPQYAQASLPLNIMIVGVILILFNLPFSTALIAACFEKEVLKQAGASAALSISLNFIFIPKYGMIGACISFIMAETLALAWILWAYNKKIRKNIKIV